MINAEPKTTEELLYLFALQGDRVTIMTMLQSLFLPMHQWMKAYKIASRRGLLLTPNPLVRDDMILSYRDDPTSLVAQGKKCIQCATLIYDYIIKQCIDDDTATRFAFLLCQINDPKFLDFHILYSVYINDHYTNKRGKTFLHVAARHGYHSLIPMLLEWGVMLNAQDLANKTALHYAVEGYHIDTIQQLLKQRCNMHLYDMHGYIPLHYVAPGPRGHKQLFELLLQHGSDINTKCRDKKYRDATLLSIAVQQKRVAAVQYLLTWKASPFVPSLCLDFKKSNYSIAFEKYYETPLSFMMNHCNHDNDDDDVKIILLLMHAMHIKTI